MTEAETETTAAASLAEEIRLLVELVVERAAPWLEGVVSAGHGSARAEPDDCGWCPLCAIVAVVRGQRPEFVARLVEHAAQLVALLRAVLADRWEPEQGVHMPGFQPPPREPKTARVQHISVRWQESG
ncbi:hypothetical protein [Amycolatopsis taiwanensis]|uniref:Uncharacterized protein n=1 Tax=Amycolatopsis taiwanensis TaxID=342230 RepID=A0A9W6RC84_9PSEU|nr:hypothetical protein [Amycolatopsis taiwanensis]GLY71432.1 hypothetical protein Atai01_80510 [Amycolatopsis taiwanensis]